MCYFRFKFFIFKQKDLNIEYVRLQLYYLKCKAIHMEGKRQTRERRSEKRK